MTLLLKSNDISPYSNVNPNNNPFTKIYSSEAGTMTGMRSDATFNINLDELLGDEYRNNDTFQIELLQYAQGVKDSVPSSGYGGYTNTNLCTQMSGLDFVNGNSSALLGHFNYANGAYASALYTFKNNTVVFKKPISPLINLNLRLFSIQENYLLPASWFPNAGVASSPFIYLFRITPYTEEYLDQLS